MNNIFIDKEFLNAIIEDMKDEGFDEEFINCTIDELSDGESVEVIILKRNRYNENSCRF